MTEWRKYRIEHVVGKSYKVWIDGKLQEETMGETWVDVKSWDEFEIGMIFRDTQREYIVTKVFTDEIHASDGSYPYGYRSSRDTFHAKKYQRLVTTAETGSWQPVKYDDIKIGDTIRYEDDRRNANAGGKFIIGKFALNAHGKMVAWVDKGGWLQKETTYLRWKQTTPTTDKDSYLRNVFTEDKEAPAAKVIPDHPHRCPHCASPSYNGEWSIDCKGNCSASRS